MNDRKRLVHKLVVDLHINVAERQALGAVSRSEIAEMVRSLLCRDGSFPKYEEAGAVNEGASLVLTPEGVDVIWERPYA